MSRSMEGKGSWSLTVVKKLIRTEFIFVIRKFEPKPRIVTTKLFIPAQRT